MKEDFVSIIVPVYNAEKYIEETIQNLQEQTYKNYEIIFVDDKSTDKSAEIIKKYVNDKLILIQNEKNEGPAISRNKGLNNANGRYICFQDADDLWEKDKIEKQLKFIKEKKCAFIYTGFKFKYKNKYKIVNVQQELTYKQALINMKILTISVMFDTNKIDKELLKMPDIQNEEIATWYKILRNNYVAYGIDEPLVTYRKTKKTRSSNKLKNFKNRWYIYKKIEKLNNIQAIYYMICYVFFGIKKRIN